MLVTTEWPLKRAAHLTSLVWVCVLWLPWKLNGAIRAMSIFNLQASEWNSAFMITLKTETCHDWWQFYYCLRWHRRLALRQLLVLPVATKLRIMTTCFCVHRCNDIYEQWVFWKNFSWMRHTQKYPSVLNISNLPSLPMCTFGIHPLCWEWNLLANMINWYYETYIHTRQDFFPWWLVFQHPSAKDHISRYTEPCMLQVGLQSPPELQLDKFPNNVITFHFLL